MNLDPNSPARRGHAPRGTAPPRLPPVAPKKKNSRTGWLLLMLLVVVIVARWGMPGLRDPQPPEQPAWNAPRPRGGPDIVTWPPRDEIRVRTPPPMEVAEKVTGPRAAPPVFATPAAVFTDQTEVEIRTGSSDARIHYTLDGSEPTTNSKAYSGPVLVESTTLIKAKCFEAGVAPSVTVSQTCTQLDSKLASFTSNLPLVIVNTFGQPVSKEYPINASLRVIDGGQGRTALTGAPGVDGRCEIKYRGFSSLRNPKRSYSVKMKDDSGEAAQVSVLGMPEDSDWVLYAPYADKTLIRDVLAYELSNKMGRYAARTRFVEVFVNRSGGKLSQRDYLGVFVFEEKIKTGRHRVNIAPLTREDKAEPNITGGYLFKRDHRDRPTGGGRSGSGDGAGFMTSRGLHLFYVDPKETELTAGQKAYLSRYLNQFEKALHSSNFTSPTDGYAKYLDVDSFIDHFWIVELSKNIDGFRYSCYMFKDRGAKIRIEPIWDWNLSFGNANYYQGFTPDSWYWRFLRENEVSWYRRLRQDPEFMQRLIDRWVELRQSTFDPDNICDRIDQFAEQLDEAQERNFQRWPILGQQVSPNWYVGDSFDDEVAWMKNWIQQRVAWIDSQFLPPPILSRREKSGRTGTTHLSMKSSAGTVFYTLDGSDPRLRGGQVSPEAREYDEPVLVQNNAPVRARARSGDQWSGLVSSQAAPAISAGR